MKRREKKGHPDMGFQIAPMIDVVFVIMLFFMVMAGDTKTELELKMKLPGDSEVATAASDEVPDEVTIGVAENGQVSLNDNPIDSPGSSLPGLVNEMRQIADNARRSKQKVLITVSAEETARYEHIAAVLNALAAAGASENVTFATSDEEA